MLGKNMIELINILEKNQWEYEIINGVFYMILSNDEEIFHISNEEKAKKLLKVLIDW